LTERGYEVTVAYDGQEGLTAILGTSPDLVLADINMPGMSGFDLLERLLGNDYVKKPVDFDILAARIAVRLEPATDEGGQQASLPELGQREFETLTWAARGKSSACARHQ
jgi:DNA-binding response OmpR family regulator